MTEVSGPDQYIRKCGEHFWSHLPEQCCPLLLGVQRGLYHIPEGSEAEKIDVQNFLKIIQNKRDLNLAEI